jgi:S-DNA-T family DNA segregation ATPase FtsK/SpoIIIE
VAKASTLVEDLNVALAVGNASVRFERTVPGNPYIALEIPNTERESVRLLDMLQQSVASIGKSQTGLHVALGVDMAGVPVTVDLTKLLHLLIAGATGSGKSAAINSLISGFLLQYTPDQLQFIMIDPKRVELTGYDGIPHLVFPVVTDVSGPPFMMYLFLMV